MDVIDYIFWNDGIGACIKGVPETKPENGRDIAISLIELVLIKEILRDGKKVQELITLDLEISVGNAKVYIWDLIDFDHKYKSMPLYYRLRRG